LHRRLNAAQLLTAYQDFVRHENQTESLVFTLTFDFGKNEFVVRQQHRMICRDFNANAARLRVIRPTFW